MHFNLNQSPAHALAFHWPTGGVTRRYEVKTKPLLASWAKTHMGRLSLRMWKASSTHDRTLVLSVSICFRQSAHLAALLKFPYLVASHSDVPGEVFSLSASRLFAPCSRHRPRLILLYSSHYCRKTARPARCRPCCTIHRSGGSSEVKPQIQTSAAATSLAAAAGSGRSPHQSAEPH